MISAEIESYLSSFCAHDSSGVTNIGHIASIINNEKNDSTWTTFVKIIILVVIFLGLDSKCVFSLEDGLR